MDHAGERLARPLKVGKSLRVALGRGTNNGMRPEPGQVLHFSEDPSISRFEPHVAATARQPEAYVWAVDDGRSPDYWFPRQCPRAMAWTVPTTSTMDRERIIGAGCGERVHAIEYGWLEPMRTV